MHHHPALSATLAEQRDDLCHQAGQARLARAGRAAPRPH
jgi:hypothetical protein